MADDAFRIHIGNEDYSDLVGRYWLNAHTMLSYDAVIECEDLCINRSKWGFTTPAAAKRWLMNNKRQCYNDARRACNTRRKASRDMQIEQRRHSALRVKIYNEITYGSFDHRRFYNTICKGAKLSIKLYYSQLRLVCEARVAIVQHQIKCDIVSNIVIKAMQSVDLDQTHKDKPISLLWRYLNV